MKFKLYKNSEIFVICPANIDTGGPMCLHQLAQKLKKKFKKKVYMYYFPTNLKNPVNKNYRTLRIPFKNKISDFKRNILIIPEYYPAVEISKKYNNIQKGLWWLSVDFYLYHRFIYKNHSILRSLIKIPHKIIKIINQLLFFQFKNLSLFRYLKFIYLNIPFYNVFKIDNININLAHSYYQYITLKSKNINSTYLSDSINSEFIKASKKISLRNKKDIICYNPRKSSTFFDRFIKLNPDIKFIPVKGYNLKQLIKLLSKSKIYMDFGFHPGQDRLPREAALLKNCIITNREGSAAFYKDVPIAEEFKFIEKRENHAKIRDKIDQIFAFYTNELEKFKSYRNFLLSQEKIYDKQITKLFK
jgi:hypothetical protein